MLPVPPARVRRPLRAAAVLALGGAVLATLALPGLQAHAATVETYGRDGFDVRRSSGWGAAPTGGSWSVSGGTSRSVSGGNGVVKGIKAGRSMRASLSGVKRSDVSVSASFVVPKVRNVYLSTEARRQPDGSAYRGRAWIDPSGQLRSEVVRVNGTSETMLGAERTSLSPKAGTVVTVDLEVVGSTSVSVRSRTYLAGMTVPDWAASAVDVDGARVSRPGTVGLWAYNVRKNKTTDLLVSAFSAVAAHAEVADPPAPATGTGTGGGTGAGTGSDTSASSETYGSAPVGSTTYPVPAGAVFVSASGSDTGDGSQDRPFATVTKALGRARSGGTIVLRGGTYHESFLVPPGKDVTIQSAPGEAVWFDGASPVTGFRADGDAWVVDGWTTHFDSSPTYTKGAPDGTAVGWQFVSADHPMAAHPDAVWIGGREQTQVGSRAEVGPGTFFVDEDAERLYVGSDPTGAGVEASTLQQAVSLRAPGTTLRGLGFRRYADSVWQQGVITAYFPRMTLENVVVADSATAGIGLYQQDMVVRDVTITGSGQMGLQAHLADNLLVDDVKIVGSNDQHFNAAPSAGGFKVTTSRGVTVRHSEIAGTDGNNFWADESAYDIDVLDCYFHGGNRYGMVIEISSTALLAGNVVADNAWDGVLVQDTDHVALWNNTIVGNGKAAVALTQDTRRIEQTDVAGHDRRRPQPDTSMPWTTTDATMGNNILAGGSASEPILRVQAWDRALDGGEMLTASDGNVFSQTKVGAPRYVAVWGRKGSGALSSSTMDAYALSSGRDADSYNQIGPSPVDAAYLPVGAVRDKAPTTARPLPADVASRSGRASDARQLGAR